MLTCIKDDMRPLLRGCGSLLAASSLPAPLSALDPPLHPVSLACGFFLYNSHYPSSSFPLPTLPDLPSASGSLLTCSYSDVRRTVACWRQAVAMVAPCPTARLSIVRPANVPKKVVYRWIWTGRVSPICRSNKFHANRYSWAHFLQVGTSSIHHDVIVLPARGCARLYNCVPPVWNVR